MVYFIRILCTIVVGLINLCNTVFFQIFTQLSHYTLNIKHHIPCTTHDTYHLTHHTKNFFRNLKVGEYNTLITLYITYECTFQELVWYFYIHLHNFNKSSIFLKTFEWFVCTCILCHVFVWIYCFFFAFALILLHLHFQTIIKSQIQHLS